ncbi:MAG: TonB family protein [Gemmatimonadetes bacterium]|nr:TonB family protein [Gemmatimonadota bacterium]MYG15469.1 TonB family protein [Gemmatimonadota bacterium]
MSTPVSRTNIWLYVYIAVAVVLVLSITLFWRNEQQKLEVQNLEHSLYNAQLEARVLQAEKIFGTPFIVPFSAVDRHGEPAAMPDLGKGHAVFLFFESWHHPGNLDMLSTFGSVIGDSVPVIGVLQAQSAEEITPIVERFRYDFPVYLAVDSPFDLPHSPHSVLIDGVGNVLHLSPIGSDTPSVEEQISELAQMVSRLESAVQPELAGPPDLAGRPNLADRPESAGGQPESAGGQPDRKADQLADEKVGIYWPTAVDTKAEVIYNPPIPNDVDLDFDGVVVVQLVVGTSGYVDAAFVERSSGFADVDSLMVDVARKTVYTPAVHDGERVKMRMSFPTMFRNYTSSPGRVSVSVE